MTDDTETAIAAVMNGLAKPIESISASMMRFACAKVAVDPTANDADSALQLTVLARSLDRAAGDAAAYAKALDAAAEEIRQLMPEAN